MNILKFSIFTAFGIVSLVASTLDSVRTVEDFMSYQKRSGVAVYHDGQSTSGAGFEKFKTDDGDRIWHIAIPYLPSVQNKIAGEDGVVAVHKMRSESTSVPTLDTRAFYHVMAGSVCAAKLVFVGGCRELSIIANERGSEYAETKALGLILLAKILSGDVPLSIRLDAVGEDVPVASALKTMLAAQPITGVSLLN